MSVGASPVPAQRRPEQALRPDFKYRTPIAIIWACTNRIVVEIDIGFIFLLTLTLKNAYDTHT